MGRILRPYYSPIKFCKIVTVAIPIVFAKSHPLKSTNFEVTKPQITNYMFGGLSPQTM